MDTMILRVLYEASTCLFPKHQGVQCEHSTKTSINHGSVLNYILDIFKTLLMILEDTLKHLGS